MTNEETENICEKVETFIRRMHDLDIIFKTGTATKIEYRDVGVEKEKRDLADGLMLTMLQYEIYKNDPEKRNQEAFQCLGWIERAFINGILEEGQGLFHKLDESNSLNLQLKEELKKCMEKCERLEGENKILRAFRPSFTGEVNP